MAIKLTATARQQLQTGSEFYHRQLDGLGDYFLDSLMADIESLQIHAGVHRVFFGQYHRLLAKRFPYSVYYRTEGKNITVYAVIDNRRNPDWISQHLMESAKREGD